MEIKNGSEPQLSRNEIERRLAVNRELAMSRLTGVKVYRALKESRPEKRRLQRLLRETPE